jgi:DNA-binding Xre family transcriptional regulator
VKPQVDLAAALKKRKISKRKFSKMLGIRYEHVFRLCKKDTNPRFKTLLKWAKLLRCRVRDLIRE